MSSTCWKRRSFFLMQCRLLAVFAGPIVTVTLGLTVSESAGVVKGSSESHLVAVADLRMPITAAVQLRDALNKALLAVAPTPGAGVAN